MPPSFLIASLALLIQAPSATLKYDMKEGWMSKPLSSKMRLADLVLPRSEGDTEDATLVITFFGGQGGTVQANFDRWITQMEQPDGRGSKEVAATSVLKTHDLSISIMDLPGTFVAEKAPGSPEHYNKPGFHLRAAVIQAFFKSLRVE